jgi:hypothetical protein
MGYFMGGRIFSPAAEFFLLIWMKTLSGVGNTGDQRYVAGSFT